MLMLQLLLDVVSLGAAYALVALGFVLVLNATGAVNFAHGDLVMAGGFLSVLLAGSLPAPGFLLLPLVMAGMAALGALVALVAYFPIKRRPPENVFISTIAVGIILREGANVLFGPDAKSAPPLLGGGTLKIGALIVSRQSVAIIVVATLLIAALHLLFACSQLGRRLRATAQDREIAAAIGIRVDAMVAATFALGAALAGAAGLLLSNVFFTSPTDGANYMLKAYIAVVIGGWGSIPGAVAGALLIALFEVLYPSLPLLIPGIAGNDALFSQDAGAIILDSCILVILLVRPRGIFGETASVRA